MREVRKACRAVAFSRAAFAAPARRDASSDTVASGFRWSFEISHHHPDTSVQEPKLVKMTSGSDHCFSWSFVVFGDVHGAFDALAGLQVSGVTWGLAAAVVAIVGATGQLAQRQLTASVEAPQSSH